MTFTTNQLIVLLDISRGFNRKIHPATLDEDLKFLTKHKLIKPDHRNSIFEYRLTDAANEIIVSIKIPPEYFEDT